MKKNNQKFNSVILYFVVSAFLVFFAFLTLQAEEIEPVSIDKNSYVISQNFTVDKNSYSLSEIIKISNAPIESAIAIYWLDNPDTWNNPDPDSRPSFVYATIVGDDGTVNIEVSTLNPGNYVLVNTFEPEYCSGLYLSQCRQRSDYLGEVMINIY